MADARASVTGRPGRRLRVGIVLPGGIDPSGQWRTIPALLWLTERLRRHHDVEVISLRQFDRPRAFEVRGVPVWDLGLAACSGAARAGLAAARFLCHLRRRPRFDVWHGLWLGLPSLLATAGSRRHACPSVISLMGTELVTRVDRGAARVRAPIVRQFSRIALRRAARVTVGSCFLAAEASRIGLSPEVVPLGVDPSWFREAVDPGGPPWRLLHVASLNAWKDQRTLLRAVAELRALGCPVRLDVVGEDMTSGAVARDAAALGLGGCVTFHGFVPSDRLHDYYAAAHLFLLSSRYESQGVVVLEAAAHGVPTVGTAVGLVADGAGEWTVAVPVGDALALARAVAGLLDCPARRADLGHRARGWARTHDADWTAERFAEIYCTAR